MYSLAPAWIAATAARASVEVPQATTGTTMCSASMPGDQIANVDRDLDQQEVGAAPGPQHAQCDFGVVRMGNGCALLHGELCRERKLAVECSDDQEAHGSLSSFSSGAEPAGSLVSFRLDHFRHA